MKTKNLIYLLPLLLLPAFACKKKGCTNTDAVNYDSGADKDDGSCSYYSFDKASIWVDTLSTYDSASAPELYLATARVETTNFSFNYYHTYLPVVDQDYAIYNMPFTSSASIVGNWKFELRDDDGSEGGGYDVIMSGTFNAHQIVNNQLQFTDTSGNGVIIYFKK